jgi:hypothetical protein
MEFRWKNVYAYYLFLLFVVLAFIFNSDQMEVPMWGTSLGVLFLIWVAVDQSWQAWKRQGRAAILTSLKPGEGGHDTIHPDDITIAMSKRESFPNFMVFATGGFVFGDFAVQGSTNFVVCPPEHVESTGPAFICHTKLRRVEFEELPDYIQTELEKLKNFNRSLVKAKKNLWFGMTSKIDQSSTTENLVVESKFLDQTQVINYLKSLLKDRRIGREDRELKGKDQIVLNIPER